MVIMMTALYMYVYIYQICTHSFVWPDALVEDTLLRCYVDAQYFEQVSSNIIAMEQPKPCEWIW